MSAATSGARWLGSLFGDLLDPKVAAPAVTGGLLLPSQEAAAMPAAAFAKGLQHPYIQLRRQVAKIKQNGISPEKSVTDFIHKNTNYEHIGKVGRQTEGPGGDYYTSQIEDIYKMVLDGIDPNDVDKDLLEGLDAWRGGRINRDASYKMPHSVAAAGGAAALSAAGANASDQMSPEATAIAKWMGERDQADRDQARWEWQQGFTPWPEYKDPNAPLPVPTWADIGGSVVDVLGAPMAGLQGIARGAYGLATGEDLATAGAQAAHMMGSEHKNGGSLMTPGWDTEEGWRRWGQFTEDTFNETGAVTPGIAKTLGTINTLPQYIFPF